MKYEKFFRENPVFSGEELTSYLLSRGDVSSRAKEVLLAYHIEAGHLISIRRNLYAVVPRGADYSSYAVDSLLIAAKLRKDAVLSHHTALEFYGYGYSVQQHFTYTASRPLNSFVFRGHLFRGVRFPRSLSREKQDNFGVATVDRLGMEIRVTVLERTLVDMLNRPDISGGWEEIWRSLEAVEFFELEKVIEYTLILGNATTAAKVGFFLEQHQKSLMVEEKHLKALDCLRPKQPHYLERDRRRSGRLISRWNLVVPKEVLERTWAEIL
jgi:predicted transcriptional regulator of viral defense system